MKQLTKRQVETLLKSTCVRDEHGAPLRVYRGEHGRVDSDKPGLQTILGSLSFGSAEAASHYAQNPNDHRVTAQESRVYPAYLVVKNPIINDPHEAFMEFSYLQHQIGTSLAVEFFLKNSQWVEHTDNWGEIADQGNFSSVQEFYEKCPERMPELYTQLWPLLDDPAFISVLKEKGFDGAVYQGSGETAHEAEYRVFEPSGVIYALSRQIDAKPLLTIKHEPDYVSP